MSLAALATVTAWSDPSGSDAVVDELLAVTATSSRPIMVDDHRFDAAAMFMVVPSMVAARLATGTPADSVADLCRRTRAAILGRGSLFAESTILHELACLRDVNPDEAEALALIAAQSGSAVISTWAAHATALVRRDPEALVAVTRDAMRIGEVRTALHASWAGWLLAREQQTALEQVLHQRAVSIARLTDWDQRFLPPPAPVAELTIRELEIAKMAAEGVTSKQIGARLFLSPRTVDNNLQRVYSKLNISDRRQLRALFA